MTFKRPRVVVSRCLEFDHVRYNGEMIPNEVVRKLQPFVDFIKVCPEVEIGLGVPRETIRMVQDAEGLKVFQPSTTHELTDKINEFSEEFLKNIKEVDGFILKNRSPSCGLFDAKYYTGITKDARVLKKGPGLFAANVLKEYVYLAIEDEGRLQNFIIRDHFYTKLFLLAHFRSLKKEKTMKELVTFHSNNKYLFMAYNQLILKKMGNIVANHQKKNVKAVFAEYEVLLAQLLHHPPKITSHVNVCEHIMGYFSKELSADEKQYFLSMLNKYRERKLPILSITSVLKSWVIRFDQEYLKDQTYFQPYPEDLVEITDSGKGRDYK